MSRLFLNDSRAHFSTRGRALLLAAPVTEQARQRTLPCLCRRVGVLDVCCEDLFLQTSAFFGGVPVVRGFAEVPLQRLCRWTPQRCSSAFRPLQS